MTRWGGLVVSIKSKSWNKQIRKKRFELQTKKYTKQKNLPIVCITPNVGEAYNEFQGKKEKESLWFTLGDGSISLNSYNRGRGFPLEPMG